MIFIESQDPAIRKEVLKTEPPIEKLKIYTSWISAAAFENIFVNVYLVLNYVALH